MSIFPSYWLESVTLLLFSLGTDGKENSQYVNFIAYPMSIMSKCEYQDGGSQRSLIYISGFLFCKIMFLFCRSRRIASLKLKFLTWIIESRDTIWWKYYIQTRNSVQFWLIMCNLIMKLEIRLRWINYKKCIQMAVIENFSIFYAGIYLLFFYIFYFP